MPQVSAPYNFVPLNKEVFFPDWAPYVSHDIPFEGGLSGNFEIEITAESPVFIRGEEETNSQNNSYKQYKFPKIGNRYYIPGSSIKGEIKSVLEILSFGKLQEINDLKYSQRDFNNNNIYPKENFANVLGGWLSRTDEGYKIRYCAGKKPGRINHSEFSMGFQDAYSTGFRGNDDNYKSATHKYSTYGIINPNSGLVDFSSTKFTYLDDNFNRNIYCLDTSGTESGTLVFTGQASRRIDEHGRPKGKRFEFVFWDTDKEESFPDKPVENNKAEPHLVIKNFLFAYYDHEPKSQSIDWKMWKEHLSQGKEIPIFVTVANDEIEHIGLSMLYKLPYNKSIGEIIIESQPDFDKNRDDLPDAIFGHINNEKLKGRVQIGHAFNTNTVIESSEALNVTLGSPKATFYPFYIQQDFDGETDRIIGNNYLTFNDGVISGRKRYPIREDEFNREVHHKQQPSKITTTIFPLESGAKFTCQVSFHNLLPQELGAIFSAITFHNQENTFHNIGMGKALGLGKVLFEIKNLTFCKLNQDALTDINHYLGDFEKMMNVEIQGWLNSVQLKELIAMATPVSDPNRMLAYMQLEFGHGNNHYAVIKNEKKGLRRYSKFMNVTVNMRSKISANNSNFTFAKKAQNLITYKQQLNKRLQEIKNKLGTLAKSSEPIVEVVPMVDNTSKLVNINFDDIIKDKTEAIAIIQSLEPKIASLMLDNQLINCQMVIPKDFNKAALLIGIVIKVLVTQVKINKSINQVKLIKVL